MIARILLRSGTDLRLIYGKPHLRLQSHGFSNTRGRLTSAKKLIKSIDQHFGTLPFCRRYLEQVGESQHLLAVRKILVHDVIIS